MKKVSVIIICLLLPVLGASEERGARGDILQQKYYINGFISQGVMYTDPIPFFKYSNNVTLRFRQIGVSVVTDIIDNKLEAGGQLLSYVAGKYGDDQPEINWIHLRYKPYDWLRLTAGRQSMYLGLYGATRYYESTRVGVLLKSNLYKDTYKEVFDNLDGVGISGDINFLNMGYNFQYGRPEDPDPDGDLVSDIEGLVPADFTETSIPEMYHGYLHWKFFGDRLLLSTSGLRYKLALENSFQGLKLRTNPDLDSYVWVLSAELDLGLWILTSEKTENVLHSTFSDPVFFTSGLKTEVKWDSWYVKVVKSLRYNLQLGVAYSRDVLNITSPLYQGKMPSKTYSLDLRYDYNLSWIFKIEVQRMQGPAFGAIPARLRGDYAKDVTASLAAANEEVNGYGYYASITYSF